MKPSQNSSFKSDTSVRAVAESGILGLVHVMTGSDPTSVIFLCESSTRDTFAALRLFTSEQIIKELQHYAAKMHCFRSVIYLTKEELSWIQPFKQVSVNKMVAAMLSR
jgi:hypothetical protein